MSPISTPGSSRPPSPILRSFAGLTVTPQVAKSANGDRVESLSRTNSLKKKPRRGSSPAMAPFLAKFEEMTGEGKLQKIAVVSFSSFVLVELEDLY